MIARTARRGSLYFWIVVLGAIFLAPLIWLISSSLKPEQEIFSIPPSLLPSRLEWDNYPYALSQFPFLGAFENTMTIVVFVLIGATLTASMAAYAFARLRLPFSGPLFVLVLSTMMIPYHVTLIPQYIIFRDLGWLDTLKPLIVP